MAMLGEALDMCMRCGLVNTTVYEVLGGEMLLIAGASWYKRTCQIIKQW